MILKRTVCVAILAFALLSLFAPRWELVEAVETTALLAARPFEKFVDWAFFDSIPRDRRSLPPLPDERESMASWWQPVLSVPEAKGEWIALGGRARTPISRHADRLRIDMGLRPPVAPDDPVVRGGILIGFVESVAPGGEVTVLLLRHKDSRVVAVEAEGPVAGEKLFFAAGGGTSGPEGHILLGFPSSRYGVASGIRARTSLLYNRGDLPPGLFVGDVAVQPVPAGESRLRAGIVPPAVGDALCRLAVLVPPGRLGVKDHGPIPRLRLRAVSVKLGLPPGRITERTLIRVDSGLEAGLSRGDLLVAKGYIAGTVWRCGILTAAATIFLAPGDETVLARLGPDGPEEVRVRVNERSGSLCEAELSSAAGRYEIGCPLYLPGEAAEGGEVYPVCRLVSMGAEGKVQLRCAALGEDLDAICLVASP